MSETENTQPDSATPSYPTQGERIAPGSRRDLLPNNYDAKKARILFVHAHPDDETSDRRNHGVLCAEGRGGVPADRYPR